MSRILKYLLLLCTITLSFYYQNDAIVIFNGNRLDFRSPPIVNKKLIAIPLKEISHHLNLSYLKTGTQLTINDGYKTIKYHRNHDQVFVNNRKYFMPQKMFFYKTDNYVPLSFFSWYLGYTMQRKGRFYYVSKLLSKVNISEETIELVFSCKIEDQNFNLKKIKANEYSLELKNTVLKFPRIIKQTKYFDNIFLSQIQLTPDLAKLIIKTKVALELVKKQNILLIKPKNTITKFSKETPKPIIPKNIESKISTKKSTKKAIWIPSFKGVRNIKISVKGKKKIIKGTAKYLNNDYILPLDDILLPFGYDYFRDKNNILYVKYGDKAEVNTGVKVSRIGNVLYAPLQKLAEKLGIGLRWDYRIHTLFINPIINKVYFRKGSLGDTIVVESYSEIEPKDIFVLKNPYRLVLDIPNAVLDIKKQITHITNSNFKTIRAAQLNEETVRVVIDIKKHLSYGLSLSEDSTAAYIHSAGKIQKIWFTEEKDYGKLSIYSNNLASYKWQKNNNQLIIDFSNMKYSARRAYYFTGSYLTKVQGQQYSWDPLTSRMIFYLKDGVNFSLKKNKDNLVIYFGQKYKIAKKKYKKTSFKTTPYHKKPLSGKSIVVEAGHGGIDVGAVGHGKHYEKWFNLDISKRIRLKLIAAGATVLMPLHYDKYMSLSRRTMFANRNRADFYLSVHLNSFIKSYAHGTETYYYKYIDKLPAQYIQKALVRHLKRRNKGIKRAKLFVLFHTRMPAVLIEPAFISNPTEYNLLLTKDFRDKIATATVEGIINYYENK